MLEQNPSGVGGWVEFAQLERELEEVERTRQIYELAIEEVFFYYFDCFLFLLFLFCLGILN